MKIKAIHKIALLFMVFALFLSSCTTPIENSSTPGGQQDQSSQAGEQQGDQQDDQQGQQSQQQPTADTKFTIAIIPDTQQEVVITHAINGKYFKNRTEWLADNKENLDLRFVIHTGDVVNWGNEDESQFEIAAEAMQVLDNAKIPSALCLGNHDTAAVGVGGSAADPANTRTRLRDTTAFNKYFPVSNYPGINVFEAGKIDNAYQCFEAGGCKWMVLSLELWPRTEVIDWACEVIENHPDYNVMVATHSYLTGDGKIYAGSDYGHNSPQTMYDNMISQYENVKFVFSGHVGNTKWRLDYGKNDNKVVSFLGCFHSNNLNPVQLLEIDTKAGTASIRTYSPLDDSEWYECSAVAEDLEFIKK